MPKQSAGLLLFKSHEGRIEVFLAHPGGPVWARRDDGAWSIVKGEFQPEEEPLHAAEREFAEEIGQPAPSGERVALGTIRQTGGKIVHAWACEGDVDPASVHSNTFEMEWPPKSGVSRSFPEVDRAEWFPADVAKTKLSVSQGAFVDRLLEHLSQQSD